MWDDAFLETMRGRGDPAADQLAAAILATGPDGGSGRLGYNRLLDLIDVLYAEPGLYLVRTSHLYRDLTVELSSLPPSCVDMFSPAVAPEWVDAAKLARASRIWQDNLLLIIGVLYAASLPSCYLIGRGIPALYATGKLRQHRFIFQRIYETGLMLEAVMSEGGLSIITDLPARDPAHLQMAMERQAAAGSATGMVAWEWHGNRLLARQVSAPALGGSTGLELARPTTPPTAPPAAAAGGGRYIWGKGFIAARKVRLLHASMRCMLLSPPASRPRPGDPDRRPRATRVGASAEAFLNQAGAYDVIANGHPINQEDLAFTLMTFGYAIPRGLERWGCRLDAADREAFLHTWRLVGYLMGVEETLLPTSWDQAADLSARILRRQAQTTQIGRRLTGTLQWFLREYLPRRLGNCLPTLLIWTQLGTEHTRLLVPDLDRRCAAWLRSGAGVGIWLLSILFRVHRCLLRLPAWEHLVGRTTAGIGAELVQSWRDGYDRRPYYIPDPVTGGWLRQTGVGIGVRTRLRRWRRRLFLRAVTALGCFLVGVPLSIAWAIARACGCQATLLGWTALILMAVLAVLVLHGIPRIYQQRPRIVDELPPGAVR
jgi:hypothetical protein